MDSRPVPTMNRRAPVWLRNLPLPEPNLLGISAGIGLHRVRPWALPGSRRVRRLVGCSLVAAGAFVVQRSVRAAGVVHLDHPQGLVTTGPYAVSRNPMYVGWTLIHLGLGLASGSAWVVAVLPGVIVWVHREVGREERALDEAFGGEYQRYRETVPRYVARAGSR